MSSEIFKSGSKTLRSLFGDSDSFYQIPNYQRPYSWEDEQVSQLWDDLKTAFDSRATKKADDNAYFLGSIILIKKTGYYDVVDGQQRLTTLTILFSVIRDMFPDLSDETVKTVQASIQDSIKSKHRLRFHTAVEKQNEFEQTIINGIKFPTESSKSKRKISPYLNTAMVLREELQNFDKSQLEDFITFIFDNVQLIAITCQSESFAIKLFQVLNARGLDLSDGDLFKSFLMGNLSTEEHKQFIGTWKWIEDLAEDMKEDKEDVSTFLNYYLYFKKAANPEKGIYDELVKLVGKRNPNEVVYEIKKFCEHYKAVFNTKNKNIYALFYLRHELYWKSILTGAYFQERTDIERLSRSLRNFYYLNWIAGISSPKIKQPSFHMLALINSGAPLADIEKVMNDSLKSNDVLKKVKEALRGDVFKEKWIKPLLLLVEYGLVEQPLDFVYLTNSIHVEHILPRSNGKDAYWMSQFTKEQASTYVNSIANLTLLSGKQNIAASNEPFPKKMQIYHGKGKGGATSYQMSQWIHNRAVTENKDWNPEAMKARFDWMIENLEREFDVKLQDLSFKQIGTDSYSDLEEQSTSIETAKSPRFSPVAFKDECIAFVSEQTGFKFTKVGRSASKMKIDEGPKSALFLVSKEYNDSKQGYWFAFHPDQRDVMEENTENLLLLGCGKFDHVLMLPAKDFIQYVDRMNITELNDEERMYWHIHVEKRGSKFELKLKGGEKIDISQFLLRSDANKKTA